MWSPPWASERVTVPRDSVPSAAEAFAGAPDAAPDDEALRAAIRGARAADGLLLGVLDDDPTGSQSMHGVQVVTVADEWAYAAALAGPGACCFVLTNSRSLDEPAAVAATVTAARGLLSVARRRGARIHLVSRSDSTLRGHVMAEVGALQAARRAELGRGFDGVLLVPAFLEAGRLTAGDIHWARTGDGLVPVGATEFAHDPVFGYHASDLREFVAEKSGGRIKKDDVASISLTDIRDGGPARVRDVLTGVRGGAWVVVNAAAYSDLERVAYGALLAERAGASLVFRSGPSFVRALSGAGPRPPVRGPELRPEGRRGRHGLIVVGSHVGQTSRQLAALRARGSCVDVELDVPALLAGAGEVAADAARRAAEGLSRADVLVATSRGVVGGGLAVAREVSSALSAVVAQAMAARPAWVVAKGGVTSHDVAVRGLGIRRAEVTGQLFPGMISVLRPVEAAPETIGMPYVVFAGNVGGDDALARVVDLLRETEGG